MDSRSPAKGVGLAQPRSLHLWIDLREAVAQPVSTIKVSMSTARQRTRSHRKLIDLVHEPSKGTIQIHRPLRDPIGVTTAVVPSHPLR
jgi:hypothetical protein